MDISVRVIQHNGQFYLSIDLLNKEKLPDLLKLAQFDSKLKSYTCFISNYPEFLKSALKFEKLPVQVEKCSPLPKTVSQEDINQFKSNPGIFKKPEQIHTFQFLPCLCIKQSKRLMLSDDMGLGKTIQTIAMIAAVDEWPVLIATPSTLVENWENELLRWTSIGAHNIIKLRKGSQINSSLSHLKPGMKKIVLSTVDLAARHFKEYQGRFKFGVLDEAHFIKNDATLRFKGLNSILKQCEYCILVSGTPITGKIQELFTQLKLCRPQVYSNTIEFSKRYCYMREFTVANGATIRSFSGSKNIDELHFVLQDVMIRRKKETELDLPDKKRDCVFLDIDEVALKPCTALLQKMKKSSKQSTEMNVITEAMKRNDHLWLELYRATAQAKINSVKLYVQEMLEVMHHCNDSPVQGITEPVHGILFFCHHQIMLREMEMHCQYLGTQYIMIDGDTRPDKRQDLVNTFQNNTSISIALLSIKACNTGLTLTRASHVVFGELSWSWSDMEQAEDRCHRIGQKNQVESVVLIGKNTIDGQLWKLINKKQTITSHSLDGVGARVDIGIAKMVEKPSVLDVKQTTLEQHLISKSIKPLAIQSTLQGKRKIPVIPAIPTIPKIPAIPVMPVKAAQSVQDDDEESWDDFEVTDEQIEQSRKIKKAKLDEMVL